MRSTPAAFAAAGTLAVLAFLFLSFTSFAGGEPAPEHYSWGEDIRVTYTGAGAARPDCDTDHLNNTHIVFESDREGDPEIYYTLLDWRDNKLVNDIRITNRSGGSLRPRIAVDVNGSAHVVWQDNRTGNWGVYYARLDRDRNIVINDTLISDGTGNATSPALCIDRSGGVYIIWVDDRSGNKSVYYEKIVPSRDDNDEDSAADAVIREFDDRLLEDIAIRSYAPRISCGGGEVHAAWYGLVEGNYDIFYAELRDNITLVSPTRVTTATSIFNLDLAVDGRNNSHIVWADDRWGNFEVYYTLIADGETIIDDTRITNATGSSVNPTVALYVPGIDGGVRVYISWQDDRGHPGDPRIYYAKIDPGLHARDGSAAKFGDVMLVTATIIQSKDTTAMRPEISVNGDGYIVSVREDSEPGVPEIFLRHTEKSDLFIVSHGLLDAGPVEGSQLGLEIIVGNAGAGEAGAADVRLEWSDGLEQYSPAPSIQGGAVATMTFRRVATAGHLNYSISVDVNDTIDELDEGNNLAAGQVFVRSYGLAMELEDGPGSLEPGGTGEYVMVVTNTGNRESAVNLSVLSPHGGFMLPAGGIVLENDEFMLESNESVVVRVNVTVPADIPPGENGFTVWGASAGGKAHAQLAVPVAIDQLYGITLNSQVTEQSTEDSAIFQISVTNLGNGEDGIILFIEGEKSAFGSLDSYFVDIQPFSETTVELNVTVPTGEPPGEIMLSVVGRSAVESSAEDRVNLTIISVQRFGCSLLVEPASGDIDLAGSMQGSLVIENTGNKYDNFTVEFQADPDFLVETDKSGVNISAGATGMINFTVTAPAKKESAEYAIWFTVTAGDGTTSSGAGLSLTVAPAYGVKLSVKEELPQYGDSKSYHFYINNTGNTPDTYILETFELADWSSLEARNVTVGAYSSRVVNLTVTAPAGYRLEGYIVTLYASSTSLEGITDSQGVTVHEDNAPGGGGAAEKPFYLRWWFFVVIIAIVVGVVLYLFFLGGEE